MYHNLSILLLYCRVSPFMISGLSIWFSAGEHARQIRKLMKLLCWIESFEIQFPNNGKMIGSQDAFWNKWNAQIHKDTIYRIYPGMLSKMERKGRWAIHLNTSFSAAKWISIKNYQLVGKIYIENERIIISRYGALLFSSSYSTRKLWESKIPCQLHMSST